MTSGSSIEKVGLLRSVGGFHGVQASSGVFQAPSYCSPGHPRHGGEWCPGRFLERLLSLVGPSLQPVEVGSPPGMDCVVPQLHAVVGNQSYPGVLDGNQRPTVPGVIYPNKSLLHPAT
jgi:hypothetical protein